MHLNQKTPPRGALLEKSVYLNDRRRAAAKYPLDKKPSGFLKRIPGFSWFMPGRIPVFTLNIVPVLALALS
jgi:hypothetical protein